MLNVDIADLSADPANVRKHGKKNLDAIVASLRRFGQQKPIVIDKNNVVRAGNGTLEAARKLGWKTIQAVRSDLEGAEMTAYSIADNRTATLAEWDDEALRSQLAAIDEDLREIAWEGFDLPLDPISSDDDDDYDDDKKTELKLEVFFLSKDDMLQVYDELLKKGLIVKIKGG